MVTSRERQVVQLEDGWHEIKASFIEPVAAYIAADTKELVVNISSISAYTLVYNMCPLSAPSRLSKQLYERYTGTLNAFVGAYSELLITDLTATWKSYNLFVEAMLMRLPTLQEVALQVFRTAIDDACSSRDLAAAAVNACSAITDDDQQKLTAAKSIAKLSAEVIECTRLDIVVKKEPKLAEICLKQLRTSLESDLVSTPDEQHKASLREQLRVVTSVLAGKLTLNELYEHWETWPPTYVSSLWSAFNKDETASVTADVAGDDSIVHDDDDDGITAERPTKKAKVV
eukprot:2615-Heterococcus_DN1.PRE.5